MCTDVDSVRGAALPRKSVSGRTEMWLLWWLFALVNFNKPVG